MNGYYARRLWGLRLRRCYEAAPPRVRQYLEEEIRFVLQQVPRGGRVLELGCGYGRVLERLGKVAGEAVGVDTALEGLKGIETGKDPQGRCFAAAMNAALLGFRNAVFDAVVCIQNGLSAFKEDPAQVVREAARVVRPGGVLLFSTYAESFWEDRLEWCRTQAESGMLGEIDEARTGRGVIVCKDGFSARTLSPEELESLARLVTNDFRVVEVDGSSLFCEMRISGRPAHGA